MHPTDELLALLTRADHQVPLDRAALLLAAHAHAALDVDAQLRRLDRLAAECSEPTLDGLVRFLVHDVGLHGNHTDYTDPENSFIDSVLDRRTGIPISLAVVAMAIGRRVGVPVVGVGMPGHFLLRDQVDQDVFVDLFNGGSLLDAAGCRAAFHAVLGDDAAFHPSYLQPVTTTAIIGRMLANLRGVYAQRGDRQNLAWVARLRSRLPDAGDAERAELAEVLATSGAFDEAASELEAMAARTDERTARQYEATAVRLRARMN